MSILAVILAVLCGAVTLVWASRHLMVWREARHGFLLTADCPGPPDDPPPVSVMIAARNEEECIERCVRTMLDQDYPNFELVVCNDRSTDETADLVERIAADDGRLRLMNITDLPDGWCGKNNAMQQGIATTAGRWICMIDADCRQLSRRTLSTAVQYALDNRCDLLSVLPTLEMKTFWEYVVQPVASGVMMIWFHPDKVNDPAKTNAYANGAFILIRRETYEAIGTHEAVKDCLNEDMHMARLVKQAGLKLKVVRSHGLYLVRMYTSLKQIVRGWSRIFFGTFGTLRRLAVSLAVVIVMGLLPYVGAALGLGVLAAGAPQPAWPWWLLGVAGLAAAGMQLSLIARYYKLVAARPGLFWTYPVGSLVVIVALIGSLTKLRRGATVVWKSTSYARQSPASSPGGREG